MSGRASQLICSAIIGAALLSCSEPVERHLGVDIIEVQDSQPEIIISVTIDGLTTVVNPANSLSYYVFWSTPVPAATSLTVSCQSGFEALLESDQLTTDHEVFIMGLYPNAICRLTARSTDQEGNLGEATLDLTVGPKPEFLPDLDIVTHDLVATTPGWTLFNLTNKFDPQPVIVAVIDPFGRYRWYYMRSSSPTASGSLVRLISDGFLLGGTNDGKGQPQMVNFEGKIVWEKKLPVHHDIRLHADDSAIMYLSWTNACPNDVPGSGTVNLFDLEGDEVTWKWVFCEHYAPTNKKKDWDHLNAVVPFPGENALLLSAKNQNALFKIDMNSEEVAWRLGEDGDYLRTDKPEEPAFLRQHAPEFVENNEILLFDNGQNNVREHSGAVQLRYDEEDQVFEVTWSWYPDPPIYCRQWGDADRLTDGNTLITFGRRSKKKTSHLIEVTMTGERVWEAVTPVKWGWYRAERIDMLPPGYVITE
jgi:arylsulfate sulfotransferase